jgi:hypothetical protein
MTYLIAGMSRFSCLPSPVQQMRLGLEQQLLGLGELLRIDRVE